MESEFATALSENERDLRNRFVEQYLEDYNPTLALIRCGYAKQYAADYSSRFMNEPYTQNRITARLNEMGITTDEERHRARILKGLYAVAYDPASAASAKVSAFAQLSKILGIEAPIKTQTDVNLKATGMDLSHLSLAELEEIKRLANGSNTSVH